tara:strand:+ start:4722 stop:6536 length:1815 start_codon:yes stop_codon:yes gene_type:complete
MWYSPKIDQKSENINAQFKALKGALEDKEAKITLAKFLRANLGLTTELISGIKLAPFQEILLKGMLNKNFSMLVLGRGCGKTFIASVFCFLQCIFEPATKILVAGPTFRTARFIFNNLEKMVESKGAELLAQAFGAKVKRNDQFEWQINEGTITAIPLNGEKIRGFRANVLVLDEYLLLPEDIINTVLMPFLVAPQNMKERLEIREIEDKLIEEGVMKDKDRIQFENTSKMIALSSASYTFENLYKTYKEWVTKIYAEEEEQSTYFVSQLGYEALPEEMIDTTIIDEAKNGGTSSASFQREYCAQFTDGSDSYYSAKKMHECTVPDGENPTTRIKGKADSKYICAIDPSFSNSPSSDFFAMSVIEIDPETQISTLVHSYAVAGGDLKEHIEYFHYLCSAFDFEMICIDNAGFQFIDSCNESPLFTKKISFFEFNSDAEGINYDKEIKSARREYNKQDNKICFKQVFTSNWLRKANEHLQACIDHKRLWFASRATANNQAFNRMVNQKIELKFNTGETILDLIEEQDNLIYQTKKQCALIEVKSTARGTQTFDLPQHLKRNTSANRARRDNYTTLMIAAWALKCYNDIMTAPEAGPQETFSPIMV